MITSITIAFVSLVVSTFGFGVGYISIKNGDKNGAAVLNGVGYLPVFGLYYLSQLSVEAPWLIYVLVVGGCILVLVAYAKAEKIKFYGDNHAS